MVGRLLRFRAAEAAVFLGIAMLFGAGVPRAAAQDIPDLDRRERLRVAVARFSAEELEPRYHDLATALAEIVLEDLGAVERRTLSAAEIEAYRDKLLAEALRSARETVRRRRVERDRAFFASGTREERRRRERDAAERLETAKGDLRRLEDLSPSEIPVKPEKPLERVRELLPSLGHDPQRVLEQENLDLVIGGTLEQLEGYLYLRIEGHARGVGLPVFATDFVALPGELYTELESGLDEITGMVLGRDWSAVVVETGDRETSIKIDGRVVGFGTVRERFLEPGNYTVVVEDQTGERRSKELQLEAGELRVLDFATEEDRRPTTRVETDPDAASLYLGSLWKGTTPLKLTIPPEDELALIRRDGYLDSRMVFGPDSDARFERTLQPDIEDQAARLRDSRDRFYRAFGYFVLSVPVTLILNGVYENLSSAVPREGAPIEGLSTDERDRIAMRRETAYWATVGAFTVNVGLFVNMAVRLYQYIRTGEEAHYR